MKDVERIVKFTEADFEAAIAAAFYTNPTQGEGGKLFASLDASDKGRIEEARDWIESVLREAWRNGLEAARKIQDEALDAVVRIQENIPSLAARLEEQLSAAIRTFVKFLVDRALKEFPTEYQVGEAIYRLDSITVSQTLQVSGSLAASLTKAAEFASSGQISVSGSYR